MATQDVIQQWESDLALALPKIELHLHLDGSLSPGYWQLIVTHLSDA